jgi:hypothetical protein
MCKILRKIYTGSSSSWTVGLPHGYNGITKSRCLKIGQTVSNTISLLQQWCDCSKVLVQTYLTQKWREIIWMLLFSTGWK